MIAAPWRQLTKDQVDRLGTWRTAAEGWDYALAERVRDLASLGPRMSATVAGYTDTYRVVLQIAGDRPTLGDPPAAGAPPPLQFDCDCNAPPQRLCRHAMAVLYAWLRAPEQCLDLNELAARLGEHPPASLAKELAAQALLDPQLQQRLRHLLPQGEWPGAGGGLLAWRRLRELDGGAQVVAGGAVDQEDAAQRAAWLDHLLTWCLEGGVVPDFEGGDAAFGAFLYRMAETAVPGTKRRLESRLQAELWRLEAVLWPVAGTEAAAAAAYRQGRALAMLCGWLDAAGRSEQALTALRQHRLALGAAAELVQRLQAAGQWVEALQVAHDELRRRAGLAQAEPHRWLASLYQAQGEEQRAQSHLWAAFELRPDADLYRILSGYRQADPAWGRRREAVIDSLAARGQQETLAQLLIADADWTAFDRLARAASLPAGLLVEAARRAAAEQPDLAYQWRRLALPDLVHHGAENRYRSALAVLRAMRAHLQRAAGDAGGASAWQAQRSEVEKQYAAYPAFIAQVRRL